MSIQNGLAITLQNRKALKKILDFHTLDQINHIPNGFNNNILWNCAHVIAVQQMLTYGLNNLPFGIPKEFVFRFTPVLHSKGKILLPANYDIPQTVAWFETQLDLLLNNVAK